MLIHGFRIRRGIRAIRSQNYRFSCSVNPEFGSFGLCQHPAQRNLRQLAFRLCITATHIRVDASKQNLHYVLLRIFRAWRAKSIGAEKSAPLVNGNRVPDNVQVWIIGCTGVRERHSVVHPAYGTHRVPYAEEMWLAFAGKSTFEILGDFELDVLRFEHPDSVRNETLVTGSQQADCVKHAAKGARCVGTATESKNVHPIVWLVIAH